MGMKTAKPRQVQRNFFRCIPQKKKKTELYDFTEQKEPSANHFKPIGDEAQ